MCKIRKIIQKQTHATIKTKMHEILCRRVNQKLTVKLQIELKYRVLRLFIFIELA